VADDDGSEVFERERARLTGLAYRLLGSLSDAEDVVQDAWFKWTTADRAAIHNPAAWLTTVVSRGGLSRLRQRKRERVDYIGPWLPDPVVRPANPPPDPATTAELSDSLTTTFLLALERLSPEQRLVVLLSDVFGEPLSEVAQMLGQSPATTRQMAVRARRRLRDDARADAPRSGAAAPRDTPSNATETAHALAAAVLGDDLEAVMRLVAPDVVLISDGGAQRHAARRPVVGADRVARFLLNLARRLSPQHTAEPVTMNGLPGMLIRLDGRPDIVQAVEVRDGVVTRILFVSNPDKLAFVDRQPPLA
jgi:RNA polymerase sigma-70 factor (ECF subfamily)